MSEIRYAVRVLARNPLTTVCAVLSLALGIGANTALFSLVNAILFKPLPGGVVSVYASYPDGSRYGVATWDEFAEYRKRSHSFTDLIAWNAEPVYVAAGAGPERLLGTVVSANYFSAIGVQPAPGRGLRPGEETERVAVIGYAYWREKFQGKPDAVGRQLRINDQTYTVIGVAPAGFWGLEPEGSSVWFSGKADSARMAGRLREGTKLQQAEAEMRLLAPEIELGNHKGATITITPGSMVTPRDASQIVSIVGLIFGALLLVLIIACANVANLLLARAGERRREMGVRVALGAGRVTLLRQMMTESMLLALAAGLTGMLMSLWTSDIVRALQPPGDNPFAPNLTPDLRVLTFALLLSAVTGIAFGLLPAWQASRADVMGALKGTGATERSRWRAVMIAGQVALTTILLVSAGLLLRGFQRALTLDPGFESAHVLTVPFDLKQAGYDEPRAALFSTRLTEALAAIPQIRSTGFAQIVPVGGRLQRMGITRDASENYQMVSFNVVSPGYLRTMGLPVLSGRDFDARDRQSSTDVAMINESMARTIFAGEDPLGRSFFIDSHKIQVVGLVKDSRYLRLGEAPRPHFYRPQSQEPLTNMTMLVATTGNPAAALPAIRAAVQSLDANLPVVSAQALSEQIRQSLTDSRNGALMAASFGTVALLLAAVGLYGMIGYWVNGRTREIGLRMALGAEPAWVQRMVVREGLRRVGIGLVIGAAGSVVAGRLLQKFLYGVSATDPATWAVVATLMGSVTLAATWIPARRAARIEPLAALRQE